MLNLSSLFYSTKSYSEEGYPCFLKSLDLTPDEKQEINLARVSIRNALREKLPEALRAKGYEGRLCEPKFFIQGSWAYKTLNRPCHTPPQQSDVDDGVYLPLSIIQEENKPHLAIEDFFGGVQEVLEPLCQANGWKVAPKPNCMRIEISVLAHIDLPLYAIPDDQYLLLKSAMEARAALTMDGVATNSELQSWKKLPSDKILLARQSGWAVSDPLAMKEWFDREVEDADGDGEKQLRRIVRYIKAFRDNQWNGSGPNNAPSSILLMAAACPLFEFKYKRDDEALLTVVRGIPNALRKGVRNPVDPDAYLTDALSDEEREDAATRFEDFARYLAAAIAASDKAAACTWIQSKLGDRFPNRPDLISDKSVNALPAVMNAFEPEPGVKEIVKKTKAG
jgi:hypothetical protein